MERIRGCWSVVTRWFVNCSGSRDEDVGKCSGGGGCDEVVVESAVQVQVQAQGDVKVKVGSQWQGQWLQVGIPRVEKARAKDWSCLAYRVWIPGS